MSELDQTLQRIVDENEIRDLVARFVDTCIRGDHDGFRELWAEDGLWEIGAPFDARCEGVEAIVNMLHTLRDERIFFTQLVPTGLVEISGDRASARWPVREVAQGPGDTYYDNLAMYFDSFTKVNGEWKFARRSYKYMWLNTEPFAGSAFGTPRDN